MNIITPPALSQECKDYTQELCRNHMGEGQDQVHCHLWQDLRKGVIS